MRDTLSLVSQINNCFDTKSNGPYFWLVVLLYDIIFIRKWNVRYRKFGGNTLPFGGNTFFKFDIYLFTKPSNDFEKWLTYPEWMMIGAASPNVIELTLVRSWSKVSIFMCRLASPHEVIWKWTNLRVSSFCEIIKQNLWSLTLCTEWIDLIIEI